MEDAAEAIVLAAERYDRAEPVNLGAGQEISIRELVQLIVKLTNFEGRIVWDASKPDGQPRRMLDISRAASSFGFVARRPSRRAAPDGRPSAGETIDFIDRYSTSRVAAGVTPGARGCHVPKGHPLPRRHMRFPMTMGLPRRSFCR